MLKFIGYLVAIVLLLVIAVVAVLRFQPQWLVAAANAVQSDAQITADGLAIHFAPIELRAAALVVALPGEQTAALEEVSAQANFSAWWTDEPFWLVEVERADVQLGQTELAAEPSAESEAAPAEATPLDFLSYLSFTRVRVGELLVQEQGVDAPLLRLQLNAGQDVAGEQPQVIALTASGEAAETKFELAGTLVRQAQHLDFDLQGEAASQQAMGTKFSLAGEFAGGKSLELRLAAGDIDLELDTERHLVQQLSGRIALVEVGGVDGVELDGLVGQYQAPGWDAPENFGLNLVAGTPNEAWHADGTVELGQTKVTLETLSTKAPSHWHGTLGLESESLPESISVLPYAQTDVFPLSLASEVRVSAADVELSQLRFESPANALAGSLNLLWSGPLEITADLDAQRLYLPLVVDESEQDAGDATREVTTQAEAAAEETAQAVAETAADESSASDLVFSEEPLDWTWLQSLKAQVVLAAAQLKLQDAVFTNFDLELASADGQLKLAPFNASIGNGGFSGEVQLGLADGADAADSVAAGVSLQVKDVELESFGFVPQEELKGGALEVDIKLQTKGASAHDLAAGLNGDLLLIVDEARLMNDFIELAGSDLLMETLNKLNPFSKKDPTTELQCGLVHFEVNEGVLKTRKQLVMETSKMEIVGDGSINLDKEALSITFSPIAKSGVGINVGSLVKFLKLGGRLNNPKPTADAGGLLKTGVALGAALSTGGLSVVADGVASRALNAGSACAAIRKARASGAAEAAAPAPAEAGG